MADCVITKVDNDPLLFQPVVANFQNGELQSDQVNKLQCSTFTFNNERLIVAATQKITYVGTDHSDNDLCYTLLTIRNKRTNEVRLVPVSNISFKAIIPKDTANLNDTLNTSKGTMRDLNKQFGSKRAKLKSERAERMKMNVDNIEKELQETVADVTINPEDLIRQVDDDDKIYRPPINRNASKVEQIYDLNAMVSKGELDTLEEMANELLENSFEEDKFVPFVSQCINEVKKSVSLNKVEKIELLLYIDAILKFFKMPIKSIGKKNIVIEQYTEAVSQRILKDFTIGPDNHRARPISMRDKATCFCMILALIVLDYELNLETFSKSVGVGVKKLIDISKVLGAQPSSLKAKHEIVLKLPLPAEPMLMGRRKRK